MNIKIQAANFLLSAPSINLAPNDTVSEICLVGKSNVGKSSFINALLNRKKLAYTASLPGKTQLLNFYGVKVNDLLCRIVDVPGYGYSHLSKSAQAKFKNMMDNFLINRQNLKLILMLLDIRRVPSLDDELMLEYLKYHQLPFLIICTKIDKLSNNEQTKQKKLILEKLKLSDNNIYLVSNTTKINIKECWLKIISYLSSINQ